MLYYKEKVMYLLIILAIALLSLLCVIIVRAICFRPPTTTNKTVSEEVFDKDGAIKALAELVRCKTVSRFDENEEDDAEFEKLVSLLPSLYPNVFKNCMLTRAEGRGLLFKWQGKGEGKPAVLMAHYDVVPADEDKWDKPPFEAIIEDGLMWGRGTLDTKVTVNAILFAADHLISQGFVPENDIYLAFSGGEEVNGPGAANIVEYFKENGIEPSLVLDEGGAVVEKVFPGVSAPCALIGIAEKGILNLRYEVSSNGGHASAPKPHTPVGVLSRACMRVELSPFKSHITEPVAEMFDTLGRHSSFVYRIIFANRWCFSPVLDAMAKRSGGEMNALLRTTVAFTQMSGSSAPNVIPTEASMVSNVRLNPKDSIESATEYIRRVINDDNVRVEVINGTEPSRISTTDCDGWRKLSAAVEETWQGAIVSPYLMVQCSDSRHYGAISDKVYRFSAMALTAEERATIHGNNERVTLEGISQAVEFYIRFIKRL